jgi:lipopolysaccharide transport protein LptA
MKYRLMVLILCLCILTNPAQAADEPVQAKSDKIWGDTKKKLTYMEGNVRIVQGSTIITTDTTTVDQDKKVAVFENKLRLIHPDVTISADNLEYNFKKKSGTFSNHVILSRNEVKDAEGKVTKDAFKLTAAELYFESDTKNFIAERQGEVEHKDFSGTADTIEYSDQKQELLFSGNAKITRPSGETIAGAKVVINTQNNSIVVQNKVKLVNEDVTIRGGHLDYDYKQKQGTFSDNVILNRVETRDDKGKVTKDAFKLRTRKLFFESETKNFHTQTQGVVEHKDFNGSAALIEYNDSLQQLNFKDNAHLKRPKGEEVKGDLIIIYIKDKTFTVANHVNIHFKVDTAEDNQVKMDNQE